MRKQAKKSIFIYLFLGASCLFISRHHTESYWNIQEEKTQRTPSSELLSDKAPLLLKDFFSSDHKMRMEFWTDKEDESVKDRGRLALHQALSHTLLLSDPNGPSHEVFKENMIENLSKSFLRSLSSLKVTGGTFQIDFHFEPREEASFNELMSSNHLVHQSSKGSLLNAIEQKPVSFGKKVLSRVPQNQDSKYHALGGSITLWFQIGDLKSNSVSFMEDEVNGFIKYRRYFSMKRDWTPKLKLDEEGLFLEGKWENNSYPKVLTVDITNPIDLDSLVPRPGKLEVFYGKIKFPKKYESGSIKNIDIFSKDITVNKLLLKGEDFSFHIKELEFNLDDQLFSQSSKIQSFGNWGGFSLEQKRSFKSKTRRALLGSRATALIKEFSLFRFEESFKKVGSK
ncbi:MAG: hypothetical protein ACJAT2_001650 [Bacteriovoracaceae bacterium]|jgi:hypothetical protein